MRHFLQALDPHGEIRELQVPSVEGIKIRGAYKQESCFVMGITMPDGTEIMVKMPEDYDPSKHWKWGGWREE